MLDEIDQEHANTILVSSSPNVTAEALKQFSCPGTKIGGAHLMEQAIYNAALGPVRDSYDGEEDEDDEEPQDRSRSPSPPRIFTAPIVK